jgi:hypothetical protein
LTNPAATADLIALLQALQEGRNKRRGVRYTRLLEVVCFSWTAPHRSPRGGIAKEAISDRMATKETAADNDIQKIPATLVGKLTSLHPHELFHQGGLTR